MGILGLISHRISNWGIVSAGIAVKDGASVPKANEQQPSLVPYCDASKDEDRHGGRLLYLMHHEREDREEQSWPQFWRNDLLWIAMSLAAWRAISP